MSSWQSGTETRCVLLIAKVAIGWRVNIGRGHARLANSRKWPASNRNLKKAETTGTRILKQHFDQMVVERKGAAPRRSLFIGTRRVVPYLLNQQSGLSTSWSSLSPTWPSRGSLLNLETQVGALPPDIRPAAFWSSARGRVEDGTIPTMIRRTHNIPPPPRSRKGGARYAAPDGDTRWGHPFRASNWARRRTSHRPLLLRRRRGHSWRTPPTSSLTGAVSTLTSISVSFSLQSLENGTKIINAFNSTFSIKLKVEFDSRKALLNIKDRKLRALVQAIEMSYTPWRRTHQNKHTYMRNYST
ncbi:hypothetical protein C8J57DRAFT_1560203 [Mycena rebaudengoi]|nr:hypothetical protein C8J57DRAFT_1560203 [Mycena rebaudengoi]